MNWTNNVFLVGVWSALSELLCEQRLLPWQVKLENDFEVCSAQQLIQSAQYKQCIYCCYQKRPPAEPLNWSWDWDECSSWANCKAEVLEMQDLQNPLTEAETDLSAPAEHTAKQKSWRWKQKLLYGLKSIIPMLAIGIHCQAKTRDCDSSSMAFLNFWVEAGYSNSSHGFEGLLCKSIWLNGSLQAFI